MIKYSINLFYYYDDGRYEAHFMNKKTGYNDYYLVLPRFLDKLWDSVHRKQWSAK